MVLTAGGETRVGTVLGGSPFGISFKEKGKVKVELIKSGDIEDIKVAPEEDADLKPRRLNLVGIDKVKRHLVDRHGYAIAEINKMAPEAALQFHEGLDHEPLSHFHSDPPAKGSDEEKAEADDKSDEPDF